MNKQIKLTSTIVIGVFLIAMLVTILNFAIAENPVNPDSINVTANETKSDGSQQMVNISGGRIATLNITATIQNPHWKAFIGWVNGKFTLDDSSGSTIYDWSLSTISGEIYATRNASTILWASVNCSNVTNLETEDSNLEHSNPSDNITATFNTTAGATHSTFVVGGNTIAANSCPTLNTYVDNATQDTRFQEIALYDGINIVYSTIIENNQNGFDSNSYDFQMLVPENGNETWSGSTAYYLYVDIS